MVSYKVCVVIRDVSAPNQQRIFSWDETGEDLFAVADKLRDEGYDEVLGIVQNHPSH
jgi:hypothetical protein